MEDNDDVDIVDGGVDDIACNELSTAWGPGLLVAAANIGLLKGETPLELKGDDDAVFEDGDVLRIPLPFLLDMLLIVLEIVCLAACFALSVETKLLTRSLRFPFTSGVARSSKDLPTLVSEDFGFDLFPSDNKLLEIAFELLWLTLEWGSVEDLYEGSNGVDDGFDDCGKFCWLTGCKRADPGRVFDLCEAALDAEEINEGEANPEAVDDKEL